MLCEKCNKNEATVHVIQVINNKKMAFNLCQKCSKQMEEVPMEVPFNMNHILAGILDSLQDPSIKVDYVKTIKCKRCGMTYSKFKKLGRLGCSECYGTFEEKLVMFAKRIQGNDYHRGKIPRRTGGLIRIKKEIEELKRKINKAIQEEAFEEAAIFRDQIKELEKQVES